MRGKWLLTKDELKEWQHYAITKTEQFRKDEIAIVDLTTKDITPYQVHQVLISLGWTYIKQKDGYEQNYWDYYTKDGEPDTIIYHSAMTFELAVYLARDMNSINFKNNHRHTMIEE